MLHLRETPGKPLSSLFDTRTPTPEEIERLEGLVDSKRRSRFTSHVPTLFLSGTLDANTPPYQAWFTSWGWPDATHIVVENAGHEALMPYPPAQSAIVDFFRGVDVSERTIPAPRLDFLGVDEVRTMLER